jgi:predicted esterase YcpF (UPF0227 family)
MVLYLHGFLSTPASTKARQLHAALADAGRGAEFVCPALPVSPRAAVELALATIGQEDPARLSIVGSSLGGYYATWLAERLGCRAVLLNPAVRPYENLAARVGRQVEFGTGRAVDIRPEHLEELRALEIPAPSRPQRYLLVAATGDEVLDHRQMIARYAGCRMHIVPGSDHALSDFERHLPEVLRFIAPSPATDGPAHRSS